MARKSKAKREEEFINSIISLVGMGSFILCLIITKSIKISIITLLVILATIVAIFFIKNQKYIERLKKSGIDEIDKMDGIEFEHYLGHLFKSLGYQTKVTKAIGDYGADLILTKDGRKIVVQAKRHNKNIGIEAVQQIHSSLNHYGADEAWVICNKDYTEAARNLAKSNHVRLIGREELIEIILQTNGISEETQEPSQESITCGRCGNPMVLRTGPRGEFYGCSTFPKCRNTISKINEA